MLKLTVGDKVRYVDNIVICTSTIGCSLVNNGHDDLFDLGFSHSDFKNHELKIEHVNRIVEEIS